MASIEALKPCLVLAELAIECNMRNMFSFNPSKWLQKDFFASSPDSLSLSIAFLNKTKIPHRCWLRIRQARPRQTPSKPHRNKRTAYIYCDWDMAEIQNEKFLVFNVYLFTYLRPIRGPVTFRCVSAVPLKFATSARESKCNSGMGFVLPVRELVRVLSSFPMACRFLHPTYFLIPLTIAPCMPLLLPVTKYER